MQLRPKSSTFPLRMVCCLVIVLSMLTNVSSASRRTTTASVATSLCPSASCTYVPIVQIPDLLVVDEHNWISGTTQYDYNLFYGIGGLIRNVSDQPLYDIIITAQFWETNGGVTTTVIMTGGMALHRTAVGGSNLFYISAPKVYEGSDQLPAYQLRVRSAQTHPPKAYQPLTVVSYTLEEYYTSKELKVTLRNDNPQAVSAVDLAVRLAGNRFIVEHIVSTLAPGQQYTATYSYDYRMPVLGPFGAEGIGVGVSLHDMLLYESSERGE